MGLLAVICIVLGAWAIVWRGPLIFGPGMTTPRFYDRLVLSTNTRCRVCGVVIGTLATAFLLLSLGEEEPASLLQAFRWIVAAMAIWALVLLDGFRRFGRAMVSFFERGSLARHWSFERGVRSGLDLHRGLCGLSARQCRGATHPPEPEPHQHEHFTPGQLSRMTVEQLDRAEAAYTVIVALEQEVAAAEAQRASFGARPTDMPHRSPHPPRRTSGHPYCIAFHTRNKLAIFPTVVAARVP